VSKILAVGTHIWVKRMSDSGSYQTILPHSVSSNFLFVPYPNFPLPHQDLPNATSINLNQFPAYSPVSGVKNEEVEMARYIRQLAECKLKELEFQKAQVQLIKESIPVFPNPNIPAMNFMSFPTTTTGACVSTNGCSVSTTTTCCPPNIKTLPMSTPIVPSPVLLSSYPNLSPFASYNTLQKSPANRDNTTNSNNTPNNTLLTPTSKPTEPQVHPLAEVISLFPARKHFICPETGCGKALKTRLGLERHSRNHTGGRRFVCSVKGCNKKFLESNTLKRHVRIHTGEKPFLCPTEGCGRSFSDGSNYRRHLSTHLKEKPFKCPFMECKVKPFGFTRAATLRTHLLNFHNVKHDYMDG